VDLTSQPRRLVGLVLGVSVLVSILGTGVAVMDAVRWAWAFVAGTALVSALAALAMGNELTSKASQTSQTEETEALGLSH
jgi:hypothetical protein